MLVLPPRGGAFNDHDLHLYQYHPIPHLYTFSSSVYVYVRVMHSKLYLCSKTCNFAVPSHSFSRRMDPSNQIFIKGSPRLWKLCAFRNKGRKGVAINFVTNNDVRIMKDLERPVCLYVCLGTDRNVAATQHLWQSSLLFCRYKLGVVQPSLAHPLSISCLQHPFATCTWVASPLQLSSIHINPQMCEKLLETFECGWQKWADTCHGNGGVLDILVTPPF